MNEKCFRSTWNSNPWTYGSFATVITTEGEKNGIYNREKLREPLRNSQNQDVS